MEVAPRGRYSGASKSIIINVSRLPIQVDLQAPQLVILPNSFQVSGRVYHELGPVRDAKIALDFGRFSTEADFFLPEVSQNSIAVFGGNRCLK